VLLTVQDLASYLPESAENPDRAQFLIDLAEGLIYETIPAATAHNSTAALTIALEVAARAYRNAQGYASERIDDYSYQRPNATQAAGVYLTQQERYQLLALATPGRSRVRSVRMQTASVPDPDLTVLPTA
jgi:pyruvoyl-dependent arginine decarboxylase (PvlArgDC)